MAEFSFARVSLPSAFGIFRGSLSGSHINSLSGATAAKRQVEENSAIDYGHQARTTGFYIIIIITIIIIIIINIIRINCVNNMKQLPLISKIISIHIWKTDKSNINRDLGKKFWKCSIVFVIDMFD